LMQIFNRLHKCIDVLPVNGTRQPVFKIKKGSLQLTRVHIKKPLKYVS
jgi:hypothetical protein